MRRQLRRTVLAATLTVGFGLGLSACAQSSSGGVSSEDMSMGNANAPITVIEYASVSCTHCATWNKEVWPAFKTKYVDSGQVRYVFREFITPPPQLAAAGFLLARCAGPDKYFGVIDQVFHAQDEIFRTGNLRAPLVAIAAQAGLNEQQFTECVSNEQSLNALQARVQKYINQDKITGTPTFVVNGKKHEGDTSLAGLDAAIAAARN